MLACPRPLPKCLLFATLLTFISFCSLAQSSVITGKVVDTNNQPLPYINIFIKQLNQGTVADVDGEFKLEKLSNGTYELTVSGIGFETKVIKATAPGPKLNITLDDSQEQLDEVTVVGKSETQVAKEHSIKSEIINTKAVATQPSNLVDLMKRSSGIIVRQTGGLGSAANLSLNGYQDRAIKYFKDGVPMDYLGAGYNFTLVPLNMLERIEVYKGVLPSSLGADALGGAVNLVSKKSYTRYAEVSYEIASFNTHRASLNLFRQDTARHFFAGADAFFNHSDNNYKVTVDIEDPETEQSHKENVRMFHNKFTHYYAEIYGGVVNTKWADELRVGVTGFQMDRENQHGARMSTVFGATTSAQYSVIPTLRYRKGFLNNRLQFDQFLVANTIHVTRVDTAKGTYDWHGNFMPSNGKRGEIEDRGSLSDVGFSYFTSRSNLTYMVNANNRLEFNVVYTKFKREGSDPLGLTFRESGRDILSVPAYYNKLVAGLGLESRLFDGRVTNNLIGKFYQGEAHATDADYYGNELDRDATNQRWGIANAVKFQVNTNSFLRVSGEAATRLPEQDEIFGDGNFHVSNLELKPERSVNANLGYRSEKTDRYFLELNSFYRISKDQILNVPYNLIYNRHENIGNVKGIGVEIDGGVSILSWLRINGNVTYQDLRLFNTNNSEKDKARQPNTPYFFANLGLAASRTNVFRDVDRLQAYFYFSFVREYYREPIAKSLEPEGLLGLWGEAKVDSDLIIPDQAIATTGLTYYPTGKNLAIGLQCKNLFDSDVFDNFKLQNAGRSLHAKVTYIFN